MFFSDSSLLDLYNESIPPPPPCVPPSESSRRPPSFVPANPHHFYFYYYYFSCSQYIHRAWTSNLLPSLYFSLSLSLSLAVSPVSSLISSSFRPLSRARAFASVQQQTVKGILSIVPFSSSKKDGQASSYNIPIPYPPFPPCTIIRRNERERERTSYHVARPRQKASNSSTLVTYRKSFLSF